MATRRFFDGAQIEIGSLPIEGAAVQTIILNRLESTAQTFNPTVIRQASSVITLDRLESTAQIFLPTVARQASNVISLNRLESTAQIFLPVVVQAGGVQTITLNLLGSTAQIFLPTISQATGVIDTSDILDRGLKRRNTLSAKEEENIAAQLLKARQSKQEIAREKKAIIDWKKLISNAINGVQTIEELDAIQIPTEGITSPAVTKLVLAELEKQKELKRLELQIATKEAELKAAELEIKIRENEAQLIAQIQEQQAEIQKAKDLYTEVYNRYRIAEEAAVKAEMEAFLQAQETERQYVEFKRQRDNRIKRLKALMWLAKIDL